MNTITENLRCFPVVCKCEWEKICKLMLVMTHLCTTRLMVLPALRKSVWASSCMRSRASYSEILVMMSPRLSSLPAGEPIWACQHEHHHDNTVTANLACRPAKRSLSGLLCATNMTLWNINTPDNNYSWCRYQILLLMISISILFSTSQKNISILVEKV